MSGDGTSTRIDRPTDRRELPLPDLHAGGGDLLRGDDGSEPAAGPDDASSSILGRAAAIRFPELSELAGREKINALTDHITATAIGRGDLEELRLEANASLLALRRSFDALLPGRHYRTRALADEARRAANPKLAQDIDTAAWLVARCTEQINRLDRDYDAASRAYTLLA